MTRSILLVCALCLAVIACSSLSGPKPEDVVEPTAPPPPTAVPTVVPPTPTESGPREISWKDAGNNIGDTVKMCGEAVTVMFLLDGRTVVNLGETPSEGGVIVVITDTTMFPEDELNQLYGENFCVTGEIVQEEHKVGVYVTAPSQIESDTFSKSGTPTSKMFRDDFTETLQAGWEWQNENPSRWEITPDGWLQIIGEDDSLLGNGTQSNLLCRDVPEGDFQITVHVYADPGDDFQQATLYLYQDGNNFVAINRGYCSPCETGGNGVYMEHKSAGNWESHNMKTQDPDVFLRLVSQEKTIIGYYAFEDEEWYLLGKVENHPEYSNICLGVSNVDEAGINSDLVGMFDYIELSLP